MTDAPKTIQRFSYEGGSHVRSGQLRRDSNGDLMRYADLPATDAQVKALVEALRTIQDWGEGPSGSTTAERSMRRIADQALSAMKETE